MRFIRVIDMDRLLSQSNSALRRMRMHQRPVLVKSALRDDAGAVNDRHAKTVTPLQ